MNENEFERSHFRSEEIYASSDVQSDPGAQRSYNAHFVNEHHSRGIINDPDSDSTTWFLKLHLF